MRRELEAAAKYAIEHPESAEAQQRLLNLMKETDAEFDKLDRVIIIFSIKRNKGKKEKKKKINNIKNQQKKACK